MPVWMKRVRASLEYGIDGEFQWVRDGWGASGKVLCVARMVAQDYYVLGFDNCVVIELTIGYYARCKKKLTET